MATSTRSVACPACRTGLRFGDAPVRERFRCPECGEPLHATESATQIAVRLASDVESEAANSNEDAAGLPEFRVSPSVTAGVVVAVLAVISLGTVMLSGGDDEESPNDDALIAGVDSDSSVAGSEENGNERDGNDGGRQAASDSTEQDNLPGDVTSQNGNEQAQQPIAPATQVTDIDPKTDQPGSLAADATSTPALPQENDPERPASTPGAVQQTSGEVEVANSDTQKDETQPEDPKAEKQPAIVVVSEPPQPAPVIVPLEERLAVRLQEFRQPKPVELKTLLVDLEQMAAIEIELKGVPSELLTKTVRLSLQNTTPREILAEAAKRVGLRVEVTDDQVRLIDETNPGQE